MSTFPGHRDVGTCQEKLAPPRSLRDAGEDAEMIWNVIVERYPKAAPLLCEMELAIERAENLLHKFRTAPYTNVRKIVKPNSVPPSNSGGSSTMLTAYSETQFSTSEENYDVGGVDRRVSDDSILKDEDQVNTNSSSSSSEDRDYASSSSPSIPECIVDETIKQNFVKDSKSIKNPQRSEHHRPINSTSQKQDSGILARAKKVPSLEECGKVVDSKSTNSKSVNDKKEVSKVLPDPSNGPDGSSKEPATQIASSKVSGTKDSIEILDNTPSKIIGAAVESETPAKKIPRAEITLDPKRRSRTSSDSSPIKSTIKNVPVGVENEKINSDKGKGDESSSKSSSKKKPLTILENYAEQCNEKLEFEVTRNKANSCDIKCSFASYTAEAAGHSESAVKNDVAVLILRLLAEAQMEEKYMKNLVPFSNEQMRDVVALGTDGQPENAMRKLFKLCLERNAPKPVYRVEKDYQPKGLKHIAECTALNRSATGVGSREEGAKKLAAQQLYTELLSEHKNEILKGAKPEMSTSEVK